MDRTLPSHSYGMASVSHRNTMIYYSHVLCICFTDFQLPLKFHVRKEKTEKQLTFHKVLNFMFLT